MTDWGRNMTDWGRNMTDWRQAAQQALKCEWAQEDESSDAWDTSCGRTFLINDGTPSENDMCYCCFCGKTLIGVPFEQENSGNE